MSRFAAALVVAATVGPAFAGAPREPDDYRMTDFRAPVPETLRGAVMVDVAEAEALWRGGDVVFIDVLPRPVRPAELPEGVIWRDRPHDTIPGAVWLPNTGYGALHAEMDARFRDTLAVLTDGDPDRALLFFCLAECWMSWNAARRAALDYGYAAVH